MSMPQFIAIAIVSKDEKTLKTLKNKLNLPNSGVWPRYYFITPKDKVSKIINPNNYKYAFVHLWVTLDNESLLFAEKQNKRNLRNKKYDRGFYKDLLPETIIHIEENLSENERIIKLKEISQTILNAFYESS